VEIVVAVELTHSAVVAEAEELVQSVAIVGMSHLQAILKMVVMVEQVQLLQSQVLLSQEVAEAEVVAILVLLLEMVAQVVAVQVMVVPQELQTQVVVEAVLVTVSLPKLVALVLL
jgi:hypothetical protein